MIAKLINSPLKVYSIFTLLAALGIYSALKLPVSLFPNSSKPSIFVQIDYPNFTSEEFRYLYGASLDASLRGILTESIKVDGVNAEYKSSSATYHVDFSWGSSVLQAQQIVINTVNSWTATLPENFRENISSNVNFSDNSTGFYAGTFYSDSRPLDETYNILEQALKSKFALIKEAQFVMLWSPNSAKEIRILLNPLAMASMRLLPHDIEQQVRTYLTTRGGGSIRNKDAFIKIQLPKMIKNIDDFQYILLSNAAGKSVYLKDIATIEFGRNNNSQINKSSGRPAIVLFSMPQQGANIKKMSEKIKEAVDLTLPNLPSDIRYNTLIDPSEFINSATFNVVKEVSFGACLAVIILLIFIGNFRNVFTAAIEIPLSLILAFILMKIFNVNINLISLGGLALASGMNVDASVVVMENIFRHLRLCSDHASSKEKSEAILAAINEVKVPILSSTLASLIVFVPIIFTSELSYAILGDLAKAVIFSHGFSAAVAIILVPTIRLHLLKNEKQSPNSATAHHQETKLVVWLEKKYGSAIEFFVFSKKTQLTLLSILLVALPLLLIYILPKLPKEILGKPDTNLVNVAIMSTAGHVDIGQQEALHDETENKMMKLVGDRIKFTFSQVNAPSFSHIFLAVKDKRQIDKVIRDRQSQYKDTDSLRLRFEKFNPTELPLPNPPDFRIVLRSKDSQRRNEQGESLRKFLTDQTSTVNFDLIPDKEDAISLNLKYEAMQWRQLNAINPGLSLFDILDLSRIATTSKSFWTFPLEGKNIPIKMQFPENTIKSVDDFLALPIGLANKVVPIKALFQYDYSDEQSSVYFENGEEMTVIQGRAHAATSSSQKLEIKKMLPKWLKQFQENEATFEPSKALDSSDQVSIIQEDSSKELTTATSELTVAIVLSIILILCILVLQFGSIVEPMIVLTSIPFGLIGVVVSLYLFNSTLSLNSLLGIILLNGISVNNSIILVDFIKKKYESGLDLKTAVIEAAKTRLSPILITSLATIFGMMPIALGFGEGGKILQPLGITISGGLWISMLLTIFMVPMLEYYYLKRKASRNRLAEA